MFQIDLTYIHRTFHPNIPSTTHLMEMSPKLIRHKLSLNRYRETEKSPCVLSDHPGLKLGINNTRKLINSQTLSIYLLKEKWVKIEIKKQIKDDPEFNKNENAMYTNIWDTLKLVLVGRKFIAQRTYMKKQRDLILEA